MDNGCIYMLLDHIESRCPYFSYIVYMSQFYECSMDWVCVIVIYYKDVLVTTRRLNGEATSLVRIGLQV